MSFPSEILWAEVERIAGEQSGQLGIVADAARNLAGVVLQAEWAQQETARLAAAALAVEQDKVTRSLAGGGSSRSSGVTATSVKGGVSAARGVVDVIEKGASYTGIAQIARGLFAFFRPLFGGGGEDAPPSLIKYAMPQAIDFQGVERAGGRVDSVDYDQSGNVRGYGSPEAVSVPVAAEVAGDRMAFDAQFWSDHASAIAQAVRGEMLQGHPINDVITEDL